MNRLVRILTTCLVCSVAACSGSDDKVTITLFQAAPDAIELGQSTRLLFAVNPPDAQVSITGLGSFTGKTEAAVSPTATTVYHLTATNGEATAEGDVTVTVGPQRATGIKLEPASSVPVAGQPVAITLTAVSGSGATAPSFRGTVHLSSTDTNAVLPADVVFTTADAGVKQVMVTLKTAGLSTLTGTDTTNPGTQGSTSMTVQPGAASTYQLTALPASAVAGESLLFSITVHDAFGNVATNYAGTVRLTATDVRASLSPDVTYVPLVDAGRHVFSAALLTTGVQFLTATDLVDPSLRSEAAITVTPAALKLTLTMPGNANAGYPVNLGVAVKDLFDNPIPDYAGTVTFTSSEAGTGAVLPGSLTFTGSEAGVASTSATFVTLGPQTITARDGGTPEATGSATSTVHGLVYTAPTAGRVRLVANAAQSNTRVIQLDLVATERLEVTSFFGGGGPGSFAAGMNLPLDTTRAAADTTLFIPGNALPLGTGTPAVVGHIGAADHVLYTAISRKRVEGTNFNQRTEVQAGQVFYSVRLELQPAGSIGPVFDGAQPSPLFRASVRDQYGDDFVSQSDFGIGKLEIR